MTLEQVKQLSDDEIRIKVAELLWWYIADAKNGLGVAHGQAIWPHTVKPLPNYPQDLNACHEMEKTLSLGEKCYYVDLLQGKMGSLEWGFATARQRCESFIAVKEREEV